MVLEVGIEVTSLEGSKGAFATVIITSDQIRSDQLLSRVWLFATP